MIFETERLILRPWNEDDAPWLYEYAKDPLVGPPAGWPVHKSVEDSREIIRTVFCSDEVYAVCHKEYGIPVGSVGFMIGSESSMMLPDDEAEIGYWIGVPFWGQGLIPEAVNRLIRYGFEDMKLEKIWCGCFDGNTKSARVQEKCGFKYVRSRELFIEFTGETRTEHITCIDKSIL